MDGSSRGQVLKVRIKDMEIVMTYVWLQMTRNLSNKVVDSLQST